MKHVKKSQEGNGGLYQRFINDCIHDPSLTTILDTKGVMMKQAFENIIVMGKSGAGKQPRIDVLVRKFGLKQLSTGNIFRNYLGRFNELGYKGDLDLFYNPLEDDFIPDKQIADKLGIMGQPDADDIVLGLKAKYYVNQGLFVPDRITNALFESAFKAMGCKGAALDGYPRTVDQARFLVELAKRNGATLDAVLLVENDDEAIIQRTVGRRICKTCGEVYHVEFRPPPDPETCIQNNHECEIVQRDDDTVESLKVRLREFHEKAQPAIDYLVAAGIPLFKAPGNLPNYSPDSVEASVLSAMNLD